ncbi:PD-(D/E)XK nuclease family protein [Fortiea sp. LEGE XX443]|uniref:PD-(D/E)XK nuclease family protein n=1 Tax=Fortiea sp. LEGE XX443 TaxID=1828611 RepID=UPI0018830CB9|nr:PD-(D/E)XK nuclease family protein [Fortiea sp. LEGE XX443]MBE9006014.1 PD-(D/E)XK nuclease family protein [Fortiea sp. LEGE XX443]
MLSTPTHLFRISQGQLNLLERCPRQFQHTYLEQINSLSDPEHEEKQTLGSRFHLLMQQREMGLPIDSFLEADAQLQSWISAFVDAAPEVLTHTTDTQTFRDSEHYRTLQIQDYLLTVIYDLLIADNQQAQILDWKTYPKPQDKRKLAQNWQTRLYMYVLAETSEYLPEDISMTYWFIQSEGRPQNIKFTYNNTQHQQTEKELNQLLSDLTNWLQKYQIGQQLPQIYKSSKACNYCQFAIRCQRVQSNNKAMTNPLPNIDSIQEISL